jgi:probable F420-dependent oxidoreductase
MECGILAANTEPFATPEGAIALASAAEAAGFDSLWTAEHALWPDGYASRYPYAVSGRMPGDSRTILPDPIVWLTWVAAHSQTIKLATGVLIVPHRHPAVLAKEVATLDALSGGRVLLGVGVGWLREEFDALGIPFEDRGRRTDEYLEVMRKLWSGDSVDHTGELVSFSGMNSNPKPFGGSVPILIGGHSRRAAQRAGALGDGFVPLAGDVPELVDVMRQTASDRGRDPSAVEITVTHDGLLGDDPAGALEEVASWGAHRALIPAYRLGRGDIGERCERWARTLGIRARTRP